MKKLLAGLIGVLLMLACGALALAAQQKPVSADLLLGQALHQEQNEGRLEDAIATYRKVLAAADATREQKARAQFRIGGCYERLGLGEARKAYEAVVANYADQADLVNQAKARLAVLAEPAGRGGGPVVRQIWATSAGVEEGRISPDGRSIVGVDEGTGDLVIRGVANGQIRRLTAIPEDRQWTDFAGSPIWSRDGRQIAYRWEKWERPGSSSVEFRVADMADGTSRVVPIDTRFRLAELDAWSPDGRRVLARVEEGPPENRLQHLAWVPTSGGTVELLASAGTGKDLGPAFLTPDGAWIVTRIPSDDTAFSIMAARGGPPRTLMPAAASDSLIGWSADGTHVLFVSREGGSNDLMAVRVVDGQAVDRSFLIRTLEEFSSFGVSQAGAFLYESLQGPRLNVYRASFDATSGRSGPPSRVDVSTFHAHGSVSWSPDGRRLAYVSWYDGRPARTLSIWSAETGQTRSFSLPFDAIRRSLKPTTWSIDGRWIYASESSNDTTRDSLYRIDTETGAVEAVLPPASGVFPSKDPNSFSRLGGWSPDGRVVYRAERTRSSQLPETVVAAIVEHRVADHAERELFRTDPSQQWQHTTWQVSSSPDGSHLAFTVASWSARKHRIMVVPAGGGPAKIVAEFPGTLPPLVRWTPDGRSLVLTRAEARLCDVGTGAVTRVALPFEGVNDLAVSPDGKEIAYVGGRTGKEGVWMLENFLPPKEGKATPPKK
jgi:Tol biopolymer transport system component